MKNKVFIFSRSKSQAKALKNDCLINLLVPTLLIIVGAFVWNKLDNAGRNTYVICAVAGSVYLLWSTITLIPDIIMNERKIIIRSEGIQVSLFGFTKEYKWTDIKTISYEKPVDITKHRFGSPKYPGRVLMIYPARIKRTKHRHPHCENYRHPFGMVCIYFDGSKNNPYIMPTNRGIGKDMSFFELYEDKKEEVLHALSDWGIKLTYDYRQDYFEQWNSIKLEKKVMEVTLLELKSVGNERNLVFALINEEFVGFWPSVKHSLVRLKERGVEEIERIKLIGINTEFKELMKEEFPNASLVYSGETIMRECLLSFSINEGKRVHERLTELFNAEGETFNTIFNSLEKEYADNNHFVSTLKRNKDSFKYASIMDKENKLADWLKDTIYRLGLKKEWILDNENKLILIELLKRNNKNNSDLIWKLEQQVYQW